MRREPSALSLTAPYLFPPEGKKYFSSRGEESSLRFVLPLFCFLRLRVFPPGANGLGCWQLCMKLQDRGSVYVFPAGHGEDLEGVRDGTHWVWSGLLWLDLTLESFPESLSAIPTVRLNIHPWGVVWEPGSHIGLKFCWATGPLVLKRELSRHLSPAIKASL